MNEQTTANILIQLRKEKNLTQKELADHLNVSFQAVSKWERGENLPDANLMLEIADFYHITVDEILRGKLNPREDTTHKTHRKNLLMYTGVTIIVLSVVPFLALFQTHMFLGLAILIGVAAIGIGLVVYSSTIKIADESPDKARMSRIESIIYPICFVIFFFVGIRFGLWYISWLVFVLGYAVVMIFKKP